MRNNVDGWKRVLLMLWTPHKRWLLLVHFPRGHKDEGTRSSVMSPLLTYRLEKSNHLCIQQVKLKCVYSEMQERKKKLKKMFCSKVNILWQRGVIYATLMHQTQFCNDFTAQWQITFIRHSVARPSSHTPDSGMPYLHQQRGERNDNWASSYINTVFFPSLMLSSSFFLSLSSFLSESWLPQATGGKGVGA